MTVVFSRAEQLLGFKFQRGLRLPRSKKTPKTNDNSGKAIIIMPRVAVRRQVLRAREQKRTGQTQRREFHFTLLRMCDK